MEIMKEDLYKNIIKVYLQTGSVKETAEHLKTYPIKVRRVLITEGLWSSRSSEAIGSLWNRGMTVSEIAEKLCLSEKNIQSYLPYTRGQYGGENRSDTAIRSGIYRERMRIVANSQPVKKIRIESMMQKEGEILMENKMRTGKYIGAHMAYAGVKQDLFTSGAEDEIFKVSAGIPRMINRICEKTLMYAYQQQKRLIDEHMVRFVADHEMVGGID